MLWVTQLVKEAMTKTTRKFCSETLRTLEQVKSYFAELDYDLFLVFDTETTGLTFDDKLLMISLYQSNSRGYAVSISLFDNVEAFEIREFLKTQHKLFLWVAHNALFDKFIYETNGLGKLPVAHDTMVLIHLWDSELEKNLEKRVKADFGYEKETFESIIGKKWAKIDWDAEYFEHEEKLSAYAAADVFWTHQLLIKYLALVESDERLYKLYTQIELPIQDVLLDAKVQGIEIDTFLLQGMEEEIEDGIYQLKEELYEEVGTVFNLNSPKQKAELFYDKLGCPVLKHTKTGNPSTDSDVMEQLADMGYKAAEYMVKYSEVQKLYSSYILSIPRLLNEDGKLRGNLNSCGTKTGRFSSNNPNLQNMPNNDNYPVRKSFVAREGYAFICLDFSQIEPRIMAHMSKDPGLLEIYNKEGGGDIYQGIADDLSITRKQAKVVVLAISYGMGANKLANSLGISLREAELIIEDFYNRYKTFRAWKASVERKAENEGFIRNAFGRVRRFNFSGGHKSPSYWGSLRQAFNTMVQGSAADFLKYCMIKLYEELTIEVNKKFDAKILLQVHDELLVECKVEHAEEVFKIVKDKMENTHKFRVPIIAEGIVCFEWSQMKDESLTPFELLRNGRPVTNNANNSMSISELIMTNCI